MTDFNCLPQTSTKLTCSTRIRPELFFPKDKRGGRLVNLAAAEGHPSEVMDMSFANQFLSLCRLAAEAKDMDNSVYDITLEQDQNLATTKLETIGVSIDVLSADQIEYKDDYTAGT